MTRIEPQDIRHSGGLFEALSDARIYDFLDGGPPPSQAWMRDRVRTLSAGAPPERRERWCNWVVIHDDTIVGYTQATIAADGSARIAYVLSPKVWGRSIAYRACQLTIEALRTDPAVTRIIADTDAGNGRSQRLLARLGFRQTGCEGNDLFYVLDTPG